MLTDSGAAVNTSLLAEELAQLNIRIDRARQKHRALENDLLAVNAELETFSADRQRFDALREACNSLEKLGDLKGAELFWEGLAETPTVPGHLERARNRLARFEKQISGILEKQASLQAQIDRCLDELSILDDEVREAYEREERRQEEYIIEREISPVPYRAVIMPWTRNAENERQFRKALLIALLCCFCLSVVILIWKLPPPVRPVVAVVPERLVALLKKEPPKPEPPRPKEEKKPEKEEKAKESQEEQPKPTAEETQAARKKAESTGVLAFKESFKDLMEEAPAARLGAEARLSKQANVAAGQARASRSLIAMPSTGAGTSSGGINNAAVSRNIGNGAGNRIGGVGFTRVQSTVAGLTEGARPLNAGPGPARTDEEIQIVFDKYKAALYRLYNSELRKNPTLRGKMILRIVIESSGEVSACTVQSNDLASPALVAQILERVKRFNFGPKEKVSRTTILYPIDFLPGN